MTILIDTREKDKSIERRLSMLGIPHKKQKLNFGDYSFTYNNISYEKLIVVERKNSISEIIGNFTMGRKRFENEFKRAKKHNCKVILMLEASEEDILNKNYYSTCSPKDVKNFLQTWKYSFGFKLEFVKKECATDFIFKTFKDYIERMNL